MRITLSFKVRHLTGRNLLVSNDSSRLTTRLSQLTRCRCVKSRRKRLFP
ncbi:hypothetical protein [Escherichia phage PH1062]|nr:hypothetical protein [Escherichia phage PH1062]